ncbi:MAG TPA: DUF2934 domain-containing protein [Devosiaceae bacterium]
MSDQDEAQKREDDDFHMAVKDTAYFLWEQAGRPDGLADTFWQLAVEHHIRARAYSIWLRKGQPLGHPEDDWREARKEAVPPKVTVASSPPEGFRWMLTLDGDIIDSGSTRTEEEAHKSAEEGLRAYERRGSNGASAF